MKGKSSETNGWWYFLLHLAIAIVGAGLLGSTLVRSIASRPEADRILVGLPYFPVQNLIALGLGFVAALMLRRRSAKWIWILPAGALTAAFLSSQLPFASRFAEFFGWGCRPELRCFVQSGITAPFYASAAYSIGAFLALRTTGVVTRPI